MIHTAEELSNYIILNLREYLEINENSSDIEYFKLSAVMIKQSYPDLKDNVFKLDIGQTLETENGYKFIRIK